MRIAQLCPIWEPLPPPAYGGTELIVSLLTEELVRRGHDVTLFASGDSVTTARLSSILPCSLRASSQINDPAPYEWTHVTFALKHAGEFDIIHNHAGEIAMIAANLVSTPMLTTCHSPILSDKTVVWNHYPGYFNTISHSAKRNTPDRRYLGVVYNAIDVETFPFTTQKDDYLLFLGRMSEEKGPHLAIEVAKRLGKRLLMAGKIDPHWDGDFFVRQLQPKIDGNQIQYLGEAGARLKRQLYRDASCLLMPIIWEEPFGLVMIEAMACGTPVIALDRGSVRELIIHGSTGYVAKDLDDLTFGVSTVSNIDPYRCREHVCTNFNVGRMADGYLALYKRIIECGQEAVTEIVTAA